MRLLEETRFSAWPWVGILTDPGQQGAVLGESGPIITLPCFWNPACSSRVYPSLLCTLSTSKCQGKKKNVNVIKCGAGFELWDYFPLIGEHFFLH